MSAFSRSTWSGLNSLLDDHPTVTVDVLGYSAVGADLWTRWMSLIDLLLSGVRRSHRGA